MEFADIMTTAAILIPFRDRGRDPLRAANLKRVLEHWEWYGPPPEINGVVTVVDDGGTEDEQFNRSRAYNMGTAATTAQVLVFHESDILLPRHQVAQAVEMAAAAPGLVVPFDVYRALTPQDSVTMRAHKLFAGQAEADLVMTGGHAIGAVNVVSRATLELVGGYDENFAGSWWDDKAMERAFAMCAGPTRWVPGPAYHLYHQPGHTGEHLTVSDRVHTAANELRWRRYEAADTPAQIRELIGEGRGQAHAG